MISLYNRVTHRLDRTQTGIVVRMLTPSLAMVSWAFPRHTSLFRQAFIRKMAVAMTDELVPLDGSSPQGLTTTSNSRKAA